MKIESKFTNPDMILACQEMEKMADNLFDYMGIEGAKYRLPLYSVIKKSGRAFSVTVKFRTIISNHTFACDIDLDNVVETYKAFGEKYFPEIEDYRNNHGQRR